MVPAAQESEEKELADSLRKHAEVRCCLGPAASQRPGSRCPSPGDRDHVIREQRSHVSEEQRGLTSHRAHTVPSPREGGAPLPRAEGTGEGRAPCSQGMCRGEVGGGRLRARGLPRIHGCLGNRVQPSAASASPGPWGHTDHGTLGLRPPPQLRAAHLCEQGLQGGPWARAEGLCVSPWPVLHDWPGPHGSPLLHYPAGTGGQATHRTLERPCAEAHLW